MNRRHFLQLAGAMPLLAAGAAPSPSPFDATHVESSLVPSTNLRDYLSREARRITRQALEHPPSASAWRRLRPDRHAQFLEMMGLDQLPELRDRPPLDPVVTGVIERPAYRIEKLHFEPVPGLRIPANLYLPTGRKDPAPGVLYVCGHAANQKVYYQAHPRRFAELGFVCLLVETLENVELAETVGYHHGPYREGWFHWYSRGYTPGGVELLNGIRALDLLASRPEVDPSRLGVTGISGGGATSWYVGAADERARVVAPVCGTATLFSHIHDRTIDGHCDCMWWTNTRRWDLADVGALIAPRPLLVASADRDAIFTIESVRQVHARLARFYARLGARDRIRLVETPGGHSYHQRSRTEIFSWFARFLQDREIAPERIGDLDESPERQDSPETLRVFVSGVPSGNRTRTIHDDLRPLPRPPEIRTIDEFASTRTRIVQALKERTFGAFPDRPPRLGTRVDYELEEDTVVGHRFAFDSEEGWHLHGMRWQRKDVPKPAPALVALRSRGEGRWETRGLLFGLKGPWTRIQIETRGTGETSWGEDLDWHLRRAAAWTGRTIASMRVWDTLRALAAVRELPGIDATRIALVARGEMAVVALYAALLDGRVDALLLDSPPPTQDAPSAKDGRGPAIEMIDVLRLTDLPQVAGLLFPTELIIADPEPSLYAWAEELYRRLGRPDRFRRVKNLREWNGGE